MDARVLVVDDEPAMLRVVAANLRARGYRALSAASGEVALTVIAAEQPDCIVLDLNLPGVGGLEVLRRLRTWSMTPVVILTAVDDELDRARARKLGFPGMDDIDYSPLAEFSAYELGQTVLQRGLLHRGKRVQELIGKLPAQHGPESVAYISTGQIPTEEMALLEQAAELARSERDRRRLHGAQVGRIARREAAVRRRRRVHAGRRQG